MAINTEHPGKAFLDNGWSYKEVAEALLLDEDIIKGI